MTNDKYTNVRTSRWGTDLVPYTTQREKIMQSRFPQDYPCLMCNRRLVKPNTVCFSCTHLLVRVMKAMQQQEKITQQYVEQQVGKAILQELEEHDRQERKEMFLERINNPKPKAHTYEYTQVCNMCHLAIPIGLGYCEEHNYSIIIVIR